MNNPNFCGDCSTTCAADFYCSQGVCKKQTNATCSTHSECLSGKCTTEGTCAISGKFVFVSSVGYTGNLGGLTGADNKCQNLANLVSLPGVYKAWLSDSVDSPSTRFTHYDGKYLLTNGIKIADSWIDLTDGTIDTYINMNEMGTSPAIKYVWTNTQPDGNLKTNDPNGMCSNWQSMVETLDGHLGSIEYADEGWTFILAVSSCNFILHLYCFEQ